MTRHDLTHWPLVITLEQGRSSLDDTRALLDGWNHWLARGAPFATLRMFTGAELLLPPPGAPQLLKQWLQQQSEAIRQYCAGMATVVPISALARVRKMNAEKLFRVPAASFDKPRHALDWLRETVFRPRGWTLEIQAIGKTIEHLLAG